MFSPRKLANALKAANAAVDRFEPTRAYKDKVGKIVTAVGDGIVKGGKAISEGSKAFKAVDDFISDEEEASSPDEASIVDGDAGENSVFVPDNLPVTGTNGVALPDQSQDAFEIIKSQIDSFVEDGKTMMIVLDHIAKAHPFIHVAVSAFKVALHFEITRRSNDQKVLALKVQMKEMMRTLYVLRDSDGEPIKSNAGAENAADDVAVAQFRDEVGSTEEDDIEVAGENGAKIQLTDRMVKVAKLICDCAEVCEAYYKQKLVVKFFISQKWENRFAVISRQFDEQTSHLQFELQIHTHRVVVKSNQMLLGMHADLGRITQLIFENFQTAEEKAIASYVAKQGGPQKVLDDETLLSKLLETRRSQGDTSKETSAVKSTRDEAQQVQQEVRKDLQKFLEENHKAFERRFDLQKEQIEEIHNAVVKVGDRIIDTMKSGPHERIINKVMFYLWKENSWKTSVKAVHLVLALHDHFTQARTRLLTEQSKSTGETSDDPPAADDELQVAVAEGKERSEKAEQEVPGIEANDEWALEWIGAHLMRPLMEAIDVDLSSFVSIAEINTFTSGRPRDWSLLHWLAYWTVGFTSTVRWYHDRITALRVVLEGTVEETLHVNRKHVMSFVSGICYVDDLLAGILQAFKSTYNTDDSENLSALWERKFKSYIIEEELRMHRVLKDIDYTIDDDSSLKLLVRDALPEQYILPLTFLLLRRAVDVLELSKTAILRYPELGGIHASLLMCFVELQKRKSTLQATLVLHNRGSSEYLRRFYHGIFHQVFENNLDGEYRRYKPEFLMEDIEDLDDSEIEVGCSSSPKEENSEPKLVYGPKFPELGFLKRSRPQFFTQLQRNTTEDLQEALTVSEKYGSEDGVVVTASALAGYWTSTYTIHYKSGRTQSDTFGRLAIERAHEDDEDDEESDDSDDSDDSDAVSSIRSDDDDNSDEDSTSTSIGGFGVDSTGAFRLDGSLQETELTFRKKYRLLCGNEDKQAPRCFEFTGKVNESVNEIVGHWTGMSSAESETSSLSRSGQDSETSSRHESESEHDSGGDSDADGASSGRVSGSEDQEESANNLDLVQGVEDEQGHVQELANPNHETEENEINFAELSGGVRVALNGEEIQQITFSLRRTNEVGLLPRLREVEEVQSRYRALWKLACDAALYIVWHTRVSAKTLKARHERRAAYVTFFLRHRRNALGKPADEKARWRELVQDNSLEDLRLWQTLSSFYAKRCTLSHGSITCDSCDEDLSSKSERYTCLPCSEGELSHTLDLCSKCLTESVDVFNTGKLREHLPSSHPILQCRLQGGLDNGHFFRTKANKFAEEHKDKGISISRKCSICESKISKPYWCCLDCEAQRENVYICLQCNDEVSKKRPWITEAAEAASLSLGSDGDDHPWFHRLILFPAESSDSSAYSMENRLHDLETRLADRIANLEDLVSKVLQMNLSGKAE